MNDNNTTYETISKFDRIRAGQLDVSMFSKPVTIKYTQSITAKTDTYVVETCRHETDGHYVFLECMDESGVSRIVLPPKVVNTITRQADSLNKRWRSAVSKATMKARIAAGEVLGFQKKKVGQ
jgi:hypothetical protein